MRIHSIEKIKELKQLRKRGYSINELVERFSIPKTTIWHHVHNVQILPKYLPVLKAKRGGSTKRQQRNWEIAKMRAEEMLKGADRELVIAVAMLYWGEGSKKVCEFINSDGKMIKFYLAVLRNIFGISEDRLKPTLRIFSGMNEKECLDYWSGIIGMPKNKFLVRLNDGGTRGRTRYGMCRITVSKGNTVLKLMHSLINKIFAEMI